MKYGLPKHKVSENTINGKIENRLECCFSMLCFQMKLNSKVGKLKRENKAFECLIFQEILSSFRNSR